MPQVVIAAAKQGMHATGYELNRWLVWWSRWRALREGVSRYAPLLLQMMLLMYLLLLLFLFCGVFGVSFSRTPRLL